MRVKLSGVHGHPGEAGRQVQAGEHLGEREAHVRLAAGTPAQGLGPSFSDDPAARQHRDAVGERLDLVEVVGSEQNGDLAGGQLADQLPGLPPDRRVQPGSRLVEEDEPRVADDPERDRQAPLLAAGQLGGPLLGLVLEAHQADHLVSAERVRVEGTEMGDQLADGQLLEGAGVLGDDADLGAPAAPGLGGVGAEHRRRPALAPAEPFEDLDGGGLAGAIRPEEGEHLSGLDLEVDPLEDLEPAVAFAESLDGDGRSGGHGNTSNPPKRPR